MPGITKVLYEFHEAIADLRKGSARHRGHRRHASFFDEMVSDGPTLTVDPVPTDG